MCGPPHGSPKNQNRKPAYDNYKGEDEEYIEEVLRDRHGPIRDFGCNYQDQRDYRMKIELPSFRLIVHRK